MQTISIVISTYNEEPNIAKVIEEIWSYVPYRFEHELLFVNERMQEMGFEYHQIGVSS